MRTTALRPTSTPCRSTEESTSANECTRTPGERIERRTRPPETITPAHTSESTATPVRPSSSNTNLAGGSGSGQLRIGQSLL